MTQFQEYATPLERMRRERGMSPGFIAERTGMTLWRILDLRKGTREARASELQKLAELFGVPMEQLVTREEERSTAIAN